jgi:hypothetical protein
MTPRIRFLIHEFAKAFRDGQDPFKDDFLRAKKVNSAELVALREFAGNVFMIYLKQSGGVPDESA